MTRLSFALLPLLVLAACGDAPEPQETPLETDAVDDAFVGTYALYAVDDKPLPGNVGQENGCQVQLSDGNLKLSDDAFYKLDVLARTVCEDENDEANTIDRTTSEGPFVVEGSEIRFSKEVVDDTEVEEEGAETDEAEPEEEEVPDLFNADAFAGTGVLRDTLLTVQLTDDLTTLTFVKE